MKILSLLVDSLDFFGVVWDGVVFFGFARGRLGLEQMKTSN